MKSELPCGASLRYKMIAAGFDGASHCIREQDKPRFCLAAMNDSMDGIIQRMPGNLSNSGKP